MKRVHHSPLGTDLWFDGLNYWRGNPPNLVGPFTDSELHDIAQQETLTGEDSTLDDSTVITLDKITLRRVK
jgi:hypothetical protein